MKRYVVLLILALLYCGSELSAQTARVKQLPKEHFCPIPVSKLNNDGSVASTKPSNVTSGIPLAPLSALVSIPGSTNLPITSKYDVATNGTSLHTLIADPDDADKLHFVAMATTDNSVDNPSSPPSRRVHYCYSSDGGITWTSPVIVGNVRLGYPSIVLYKRDGKNVPIIAAHQGPIVTGKDSVFTSKIFIEQGAPGDGNFKMYSADNLGSTGTTNDFGFPTIILSPNQDKLYIVGCAVSASKKSIVPAPLEFGTFSLDANRGATWNKWTARPGGDNIKAKSSGGEHVIRVAPNGTIGVIWAQGEDTDKSLYFVESTDGGKSWTSVYDALYLATETKFVDGRDSITYMNGYEGLDFFYDKKNTPHFFWAAYYRSNTQYVPQSTCIFSYIKGDAAVNIISSGYYDVTRDQTLIPFDNLTIFGASSTPVNILHYDTSYFLSNYLLDFGNHKERNSQGAFISDVSLSLSTNPNFARLYFTTFQNGDTATVDYWNDGNADSIQSFLYRNIYYHETTDGGSTWSVATPFAANVIGGVGQKFDFHFPSVPVISSKKGNSTQYDVVFLADTFAGKHLEVGSAGWYDQTWYHKSASVNKVSGSLPVNTNILGQNYPNPVSVSTTIPVTLSESGEVTLTLEDVLGRSVKTIFSGMMTSGSHNVSLSSASLAPGVYRYTIRTRTESDSRLLTIVR